MIRRVASPGDATVKMPDQIRSLRETAAILGLSMRQLQRLIAMGTGPAVIHLSERRVGISDADREAWVGSRRRIAASNPETKETFIAA
jgi:predicted DNA-binding transcriptional regulator AlpA